MNTSLSKRIRALETNVRTGAIPQKEKIVVVSYQSSNDSERERLIQNRLSELRKKYVPDISTDDLLIVAIRKFGI